MCRDLSFLVALSFESCSFAHFHILIPEKSSHQIEDVVALKFKFGHPVEHELPSWQATTTEAKETEMIKNKATSAMNQLPPNQY